MPVYEVRKCRVKGGAEAMLTIIIKNPTSDQDTEAAQTCIRFLDETEKAKTPGTFRFWRNEEMIKEITVNDD